MKFKIFLLTIAFSVLMSITVFADVKIPSSDKYEQCFIYSTSGGGYSALLFNGDNVVEFVNSGGRVTIDFRSPVIYGICHSSDGVNWDSISSRTTATEYINNWTGTDSGFTVHASTVDVLKNGEIFFRAPLPSFQEVMGKQTQKIIPDLSSQLKILLPFGVIILSIILAVSLVPRLVHLFL